MKVSVVIPVYNAEKYFGACLESLLIQTLTDFEVIVVDDCSTDSSMAIAESYVERFGGRLKIINLPQNTGSGSVPRNVGLEHARGEYVYFVDNDDFLVGNALEILYNFAQSYRADVVFMEKFFLCDEEPVAKSIGPVDWLPDLPDENSAAIFESDELVIRVEKFLNKRFFCSPWSKFLRREFLVDNLITLPQMKIGDDILWTFKIVCLAKKILRVPARVYVHRNNSLSVSRRKRSPEQQLTFYTSPLSIGAELFAEFMRDIEVFRRNPDLNLRVLMFYLNVLFDDINADLKCLKPAEACRILLDSFSAEGSTQPALIACLIVMMNIYKQTLIEKEKS